MPLRVAAGLVAVTVEKAQQLPRQVVELPVTTVSQLMQISMRVQQRLTDLAIKGDRALSSLRPVQDNPSWATFDDEAQAQPAEEPAEPVGELPVEEPSNGSVTDLRPPAMDATTAAAPGGLPGYDQLSLAQLRARLRRLSVEQLTELLAWETAHQDRPAFVTMLGNRITTVADQ